MKHLAILALTTLLPCQPMLRAEDNAVIVPHGPVLMHPAAVHGIALSPDGIWAATGCYGNTAHVWDAATGKAGGEPLQHGGPVRAAVFSADSQMLMTGSFDKTARLWRITTK